MFSQIGASPESMKLCIEHNVGVPSVSFWFLYSITGLWARGNVLLRHAQYKIADNPNEAGALAPAFCGRKSSEPTKSPQSLFGIITQMVSLRINLMKTKYLRDMHLKNYGATTDIGCIMGIRLRSTEIF